MFGHRPGAAATRARCLLLTASLLGIAVAPAGAQDADSRDEIQLKGSLIEVRAVVTDERGRLRDDLQAKDFEVLDDGKPQEIAFFSVEHVGRPPVDPATSTGPATPAGALPGTREGAPSRSGAAVRATRTIVLFADTLHLSASSVNDTRKAMRAFVDSQMTSGDVAAVVATDGSLGLASQFTQDRRLLGAAIDKISASAGAAQRGPFTPFLAAAVARGDNSEALTLAKYIIIRDEQIPPEVGISIEESKRLEAMARQRALQILADETGRRRRTLAALEAIAGQMASLPGQRLLALFTDGFTLADTRGDTASSDVRSAVDRAVRAGVVIYSIDPGGLQSGFGASFDENLATGPPALFAGHETASRRDLEQASTALARDTGGEVVRNTNDLPGAFRKLLDSNRVYYTLAYYMPEGEKDEKRFREITVRLKNHPGLIVRAQKGYLASRAGADSPEGPADAIVAALASPVALTQIPVSVRADFVGLAGAEAQVVLNVHVDGEALEFREDGARRTFALDVATSILDELGRAVETKSETLEGSLLARPYELARANGFRVTRRVALKPGLYQVRVAVREAATSRVGTATSLLEVPDAGRGRLVPTSLFLAESASETGTVFSPRTKGGRLTFVADDFLIYSLTVFNAWDSKSGERDLTMRVTVLRDGMPVFESPWEPVAAHLVERRGTAAVISGQLKLAGVPVGAYTFRVEVRDTRRDQTVTQTADFHVAR
jgi:VWFA-related protein